MYVRNNVASFIWAMVVSNKYLKKSFCVGGLNLQASDEPC